jgi:hypothetical protein
MGLVSRDDPLQGEGESSASKARRRWWRVRSEKGSKHCFAWGIAQNTLAVKFMCNGNYV